MRSGHLSVLLPFIFVAQVAAHGYVKTVSIDGTSYAGNVPYRAPTTNSPIRLINDVDPVMGTTNAFLACGQGAENGAMVAPANPGSKVAFNWVSGTGGNWPHNTGPILTYMARCEGTTCDKYDATNANWFKIDQAGQRTDGSGWWMADIMQGKSYTVTLPTELAPGDYLIRHELIGLQRAATLGDVEFFPSCTQVRVGGSGTGVPSSTVHFPGAYAETDPGLYTPDVYNPGFVYQFPGPAVATFGKSGSGSSSSSVSSHASSSHTVSSTHSSSHVVSSTHVSSPTTSTVALPSSTSSDDDDCWETVTVTSYPSSAVHHTTTHPNSHVASTSTVALPSSTSTDDDDDCWETVTVTSYPSSAAVKTTRTAPVVTSTSSKAPAPSSTSSDDDDCWETVTVTSYPASTAVHHTTTSAPHSHVASTSTAVLPSSTSSDDDEDCWVTETVTSFTTVAAQPTHSSSAHRMARIKRADF